MKGFIKKDLLLIKNNLKIYLIIYAVYIMMAFQGQMDISSLPVVLSVLLMMSSFNYDNYNKWNAYSATLPNGRENVVRAKYISTLILVLITTTINTIISFVIAYFNPKVVEVEEIIPIMLGVTLAAIIMLSIIYPIIYKVGVEKAGIVTFILIFGIVIVFGFLSDKIDLTFFTNLIEFISEHYLIVTILCLALFPYISYKISRMFFLKKEF